MEKTANQNIKPLTTKINDKGNLEIGGCDLISLVETYGSPLYVYDEKTIREMARAYKKAFEGYKNTNMMFASKSFMTMAICKILNSEGFAFDVVSLGEMYTVYKALGSLDGCVFNGNNKSFEEIEFALDNNIARISVDNYLELAMLNQVAKSKNKKVDVLLRITPGIECHTHQYIQTGHLDSKFGFDLTQLDEVFELINDEYANLNPVGLHAHIGSQIFETSVYYDEVKIILEQIRHIKDKFNINLNEINLGGGLGIKYTEEDMPPSVFEIANKIITSIEKYSKEYNVETPTIYIEPGRSLVGTAGVTLYTVGSSKQVPNGKKYVAVDGGMADNARPSLYQAKYTAQVANKPNMENIETITLAGRFCESGDILIENIQLPKLEEGDVICVYDTGAYGYSMSSNYNRVLKPACVLVNNSQSDIIIKKETLEQLIENDIIPKSL